MSNGVFYYLITCTYPALISPTVCILPLTLHLAETSCFYWRGKEQALVKTSLTESPHSDAPWRRVRVEEAKA